MAGPLVTSSSTGARRAPAGSRSAAWRAPIGSTSGAWRAPVAAAVALLLDELLGEPPSRLHPVVA
ncbi:hypothetical protein, partial [Aquipuribacter hungaricus]|uniref:hypothetical protein n=1 Tax=Aquipuribacter hungaricus TaxID=545624 RepID=UPI0030ECDCCA